MNGKEQQRAVILTGAIEGRLTAGEAAELMGLSERHVRRLRHAFVRDAPTCRGWCTATGAGSPRMLSTAGCVNA